MSTTKKFKTILKKKKPAEGLASIHISLPPEILKMLEAEMARTYARSLSAVVVTLVAKNLGVEK